MTARSTKETRERPDAIVIGAGLGGLSCALHLAKQGMKVTVLEKQPGVGGYAQNFMRSGYDFDVSLHVLSSLDPGGGLYRILDDIQVLPKLEIIEHSPMFTSVFGDDIFHLPGGETASAYLSSRFPAEAAGIDRFFQIIRALVNENGNLFFTGEMNPLTFAPARYFKKTWQDLLNECFTDPRLFGLLGQLWQSTGLPNDRCAANWAAEVFGSHILSGNYYIRGGGQRLTDAMAETLAEAGCTVRTSCLVRNIRLRDRQVTGVELDNGEQLLCNTVISNANPLQAYLELIGPEHLSKPFLYKLGTLERSCSLLTIYLGLDCPAVNTGLTDRTVFVNADYDNSRAFADAMAERHDITDYLISDYTDEMGTTHPRGCGMLQILEVANGPCWTDIPRDAYIEKKKRVTETILQKVYRRYPGIADHIDICEIGTPRAMALNTRNPGGSVYGWAQTPGQADQWRFGVSSLFKGLYFTGAWARGGGGGYMGAIVNGRVAAREIIKKQGWTTETRIFRTAAQPQNAKPIPAPQPLPITVHIEPAIYNRIPLTTDDLSPEGHLLPHACMRISHEAASRYVNDHRIPLSRKWTESRPDETWSTTFFQMRFVFVPFIQPDAKDVLRAEVRFAPADTPGRGEFTINLFMESDHRKVANAAGRVLIRTTGTS